MATERAEEGELEAGGDVLENESALRGPQFNPPLYVQRYEAVLAACKQLQAAKVKTARHVRPLPVLASTIRL